MLLPYTANDRLIAFVEAEKTPSPRDRKDEGEIELLRFMGLFIRDEMWWTQGHRGR